MPFRALLLPLTLLATAASAQIDVRDLDRRLPTQLNDAYPLAKGDLQFHFDARLDHRPGEHPLGGSPEIQYGFEKGWYVQVGVPTPFRGDRKGGGNVEIELFRGTADMDSPRTAFAGAVRAVVPSGVEARGIDTDVELIVTQPLRRGLHDTRLHLNVGWQHNASPLPDERADGYLGVLGLSSRLDPRCVAIVDLARDRDPHEAGTTDLAELGLIRSIGGGQEFALGLGWGLGHDSPHHRVTVGYQVSF